MVEFTPDELEANGVTADTAAPPAAVTSPQQPARDEQGRFAAADDAPETDKTQRTARVPHQALHAEREAHKGTKAQLQAAQAQLQQIRDIREKLRAQPQQQDDQAAQTDDDPDGVKHLRQRVDQLQRSNAERDTRDSEAAVNQHERNLITSHIQMSEAAFREQTPDYEAAVNHLGQARARQLQISGFQPHEIQQTLAEEVMEIARSAIQQGRSPAEVAYEWAQTYGYQPQKAQPQANAMLDAIADGQRRGRSLAGARGGATAADVNANALANMDEAEFARLAATPEGQRLIDSLG